jgi:phosphoglycolate phosphatase
MQNYIFDFDGTLDNTEPLIVDSWQQTCKRFNLPNPNVDMIKSSMGLSLDKVAQNVSGIIETEQIKKIIEIYREIYFFNSQNVELFGGIFELLEKSK